MKAMILAAGKGTRMQPLTYELPKPMIPMLGKPVMEYLVEELARHGFDEIMVNVSHLPDRIERYFGDGRRWGVEIGYSFEGCIEENAEVIATPIGSAGGLKRIADYSGFFDDTFVVVCGDALIDLDLTSAVREHWKSGAVASVVCLPVERERVPNYGVVVCDAQNRIQSFQEKPSVEDAKSNLVNTGIYFFEPSVLDLIPARTEYDIGSELFPDILKHNLPFNAISMPFHWIDIGRLSDYWEATMQLMRGRVRDIPMPGKQVMPGIWTGLNVDIDWERVRIEGPVFIGSSSRIEPDVEIIGPAWIGHGCHIETGAKIVQSILFEHTRIGSNGRLNEAVVFGRNCVDKDGTQLDHAGTLLDWVGDARHRDSLGYSLAV